MTPPSTSFTLSLPSRPQSVTIIRHVLAGVEDVWPTTSELLDDVQIAVTEACANVVAHAYRETPAGTVDVHGEVVDEQIVVTVRDQGPGMVPPRHDSPGLGLGIPLILALTDQLHTGHAQDGAHEVRMTFPRPSR